MATPTLKGRITLDDSLFVKGLRGAKSAAFKFGATLAGGLRSIVSGPIAAIGAALAGAFGVMKFAEGIKGAYDMGGALLDLENQTGAAGDELLIFQQVLKDNGSSAEEAVGILNKLQFALAAAADGSKIAGKGFDQLGLDAQDLLKKTPVEQFQAIAAAIAKLPDAANRTKAARDIFGRSGGRLLSVINGGGFQEAAASIGKQGKILKDNAELFDTISDRLGRVGLKFQGFFVGAAVKLAPALNAFTERLDKVDLEAWGEGVADGLLKASDIFVGVFQDPGKLLSAFGLYLEAIASSFTDAILSPNTWKKVGDMLNTIGDAPFKWLDKQLGINGAKQGTPADAAGPSPRTAELFAQAHAAAEDIRAAGRKVREDFEAGSRAVKAEVKKPFSTSTLTKSSTGGLKTGSLSTGMVYFSPGNTGELGAGSPLNKGAYGRSPLLSARERRGFNDAAIAAGSKTREGLGGGAYNAIRSGDTRRRKEQEKERERQKLGIDKSNELLEGIKMGTDQFL